MPELERLLWNFLFAAKGTGTLPPEDVKEIEERAVKELAEALEP
jgi:hypothetical protein